MANNFIEFESTNVNEIKRKDLREARKEFIQQKEKQFQKEQFQQEQAKKRGEGTWILPSLDERICKEQQDLEKSKSKKQKKDKKKKHKKEKKKKKAKHRSSSSSESDSNEGEAWVEAGATSHVVMGTMKISESQVVKGPKLERDSWMSDPFNLGAATSRQEIRDKQKKEKEEANKETNLASQPGRHHRELNPYWKDGGTGLPEDNPEKSTIPRTAPAIGDNGLTWLRKSYQKCVSQAKEESRSLEDVAAERWGSLENLKSKLAEAERNQRRGDYGRGRGQRSSNGKYTQRDSTSVSSGLGSLSSKKKFLRPGSDDEVKPTSRSRTPERKLNKSTSDRQNSRERRSRSQSPLLSRERQRSSSRDRQRRRNISRSRSRSKSRDRQRKENRSRSRSRSRSKDRVNDRREKAKEIDSRNEKRLKEDVYSEHSQSRSLGTKFMKPGEMDSGLSADVSTLRTGLCGTSRKKTVFLRPDMDDTKSHSLVDTRSRPRESAPAWKKKEYIQAPVKEKSQDKKRRCSSSSSSESSSEDSGSEAEVQKESSVVEVQILSEKELNELGAKILRAELMGDEEMAEQLKSKMEAAQKAKEQMKSAPPSGPSKGDNTGDEENMVVLTRTNQAGMAWPLPDRPESKEAHRGRQKKKMMSTHGEHGERQRYFGDDDQHDLQTMVEREKLGTAESQNTMFARLAGRKALKTDDDFQVDDMFLERAAHSSNKTESKTWDLDRARAVLDHTKMATALQKCPFCFENVPKHLIIAIGTKVYICLPSHKSLAEGHCLIVPMSHTSSGTAVDEDVWEEIQLFRKVLTKMFGDRDEDVAFMETSMHLKHFPHMHIECVPMEKEIGDMAPIYFKKAILDAGPEWAQNKKLVNLSNKNIRHSVPKGFPYFSVDFGLQGGFAHVIEEEYKFPQYFGREIIGGMIDVEPALWRKPRKENFDDQRKKVLQFAEWWKPYDWTSKLHSGDDD